MRSALFMLYLYGGMAALGILAFPLALVNRAAGIGAIRLWALYTLFGLRWIAGVRVRFEGLEHVPDGPVLIASKHQSNLETIAAFLVLRDPAMVLKRELLKLPLYGWFAVRTGMIVVDRDAHAKALRDLVRHAKARFAEGRPVLIFPEGTRRPPGAPPDYKPGVAALYRELGSACVPVALNTGQFWDARGKLHRRGAAVLRFLPPIPPGLSRQDFMQALEGCIEPASAALTADSAAFAHQAAG
ncbi:MAG: 1-acyl-sn-glycerol-3-phosphate acyltransferase [Hyphomonadaceae bacterium]|nr:1-acyl-sn-glycerol-3-phosphate acyltransferase [Hyphomonadaceae bacterium]